MNDQAIEQEIKDKGLNAPRVTPADIEANIASEHYFTAKEGALGMHPSTNAFNECPAALGLLTFCVIILRNGFTVTGESACASPENFDAELGRKISRQNAVAKIRTLMGYELRTQLSAIEREADRVAAMDDANRRIRAINCGDLTAKFSDDELVYAATTRCACGAGMAYPKDIGPNGSWHCSDILTFRAATKDKAESVGHDSPMPFTFYSLKSENQPSAYGATTRPVSVAL